MNHDDPKAPQDGHNAPPEPDTPRRRFLKTASVALQGAIAVSVAVPVIGAVTFPVDNQIVKKPSGWSPLGPTSRFPLGAPVKVAILGDFTDAWVRRADVSIGAAWVVRRDEETFDVFSTVCPHLGCGIQWREAETEFHCPCHGSHFSKDGERVEAGAKQNPAPRGMDALEWRVDAGQLLVKYARYRTGVAEREPIA